MTSPVQNNFTVLVGVAASPFSSECESFDRCRREGVDGGGVRGGVGGGAEIAEFTRLDISHVTTHDDDNG